MPRPKGRPNRPFPILRLDVALEVGQAIKENNAGKPMNRLLLAEAMKYSPSSSGFRDRIASSSKFELTSGNYHSETISLTQVGVAACSPRNHQERVEAHKEAFLAIPIFKSLLDHYANARLPEGDFLKNVLEREPFGIDPAWSTGVAEAFRTDAEFVGYLREIGGAAHIVIDSSLAKPDPALVDSRPSGSSVDETVESQEEDVAEAGAAAPLPEPPASSDGRVLPMQLFIAHGRSRKPLEQLKRILNDWQVPFLVAVDEPNAGRPISKKVAETMRQCSAGVFIFTGDEELADEHGEIVLRPSQNVVYELGAASLLYGRKIVVLKEVGVNFPSDFSDLGWIEFEKDALEAKALDLLRELIALKAVRLVSAASM